MRKSMLNPWLLIAALSVTACGGSNLHVNTASQLQAALPVSPDLEPSNCPIEPAPPAEEVYTASEADPTLPDPDQQWEAQLLQWGRCHSDARIRECNYYRELFPAAALVCTTRTGVPAPLLK